MNDLAPQSAIEVVAPRRSGPLPMRGHRLPPLTITQILDWADRHHARTRTWPTADSGWVFENRNEMWRRLDAALRLGLRGLERGCSLAKLIDRERGVRNPKGLPPLVEAQIAAWAQLHHQGTGVWPTETTGPVPDTRGEVWGNIDAALRMGIRGLPGGDSLPRLLARQFGVRLGIHRYATVLQLLPPLTVPEILRWADAYFAQTGAWPKNNSGLIAEAPGRKWSGVNGALRAKRVRGLRGPCTLAQLLTRSRGVRNPIHPPRLSVRDILRWADAHCRQTGQWPTFHAGVIAEAPEETWGAIHSALKHGGRGLGGGGTLARLLATHRGVRNPIHPPRLTVRRVLAWADAHVEQTGRWPKADSGAIAQAPGERWSAVNNALRLGLRGFGGGSSLAQLLAQHRRVPIRDRSNAEPVTAADRAGAASHLGVTVLPGPATEFGR